MKEWTVIRQMISYVPDVRMTKAEQADEAIEVFHPNASKKVPAPVKDYLGNRVWMVIFKDTVYFCIEPE